MPQIHEREVLVREAERAASEAIAGACQGLTEGERLRVLASVLSAEIGGTAKYMIREERHPGDPDRPGGWAPEGP
jgi:hypothetical protein